MNLTTPQILLAIGIFLTLSFTIIKLTRKYAEKTTGSKTWKIGGGKTGYYKGTLLVCVLLTAVLMLILKNTILN